MRIVSIGDLVTDFYYKNNKIIGVNGGMTSHNIVANLSKFGLKTKVFGICGNDSSGKISIDSLQKLNIDIDDIEIDNSISTRCFHVSYFEENGELTFTSKKRCPFCNEKIWYDESLISTEKILTKLEPDDILVFDNLNEKNQIIINSSSNKKIIDLGQYFELEDLTNEQIINKINNKFEIINFNERVSKYLLKRLNIKTTIELYELLNAKLITITKGEKGADFIYNNKCYSYELETNSKVKDSTGAGDAFISSIIYDWLKNNMQYDIAKFETWYQNSCKLTSKVVKEVGARGHLQKLYKIKKVNNLCTCKDFEIVTRKKIKRCNININNLETRIYNALKSEAINDLKQIEFKENDSYAFIGTGGSYAGAKFASIIINEKYGSNTYALYPRDFKYRNNNQINKIFLFSYSGTTNDILEGTKDFKTNNKYIITKNEKQKVVIKTEIPKKNIISYRTSTNKGKERGFLSFEGALVPATLFLKCFYENLNIEEFINERFKYWNNYLTNEFKKEEIKNIFKNKQIINIFTGDYTTCAGIDIESKITESGVGTCILHEKKNFSHGRFINYENLNNKNSIYFKGKNTSKYEESLIEYLNKGNNIFIESNYDGLLCEYDLLLASQLLIYYVGKILDIDVSKPNYSEDAMKIYFYKGTL